jgi:hypothetical protein
MCLQEEVDAGNANVDPHTVNKMLRVRWEQHSRDVVAKVMNHNTKIMTWAVLRVNVRIVYRKRINATKAARFSNTRVSLRILGAWRGACKGSKKPGGTKRYARKKNLNRIFYMLNSSLLMVAFGQVEPERYP